MLSERSIRVQKCGFKVVPSRDPFPLLLSSLDRADAEEWIREQVEPVGAIETVHVRPWATVMRVPVAAGVTWFKACAQVQAFEPRLTGELYARWPDRVTEVLAVDEVRRWLLLGDAGIAVRELGNPPEAWLEALPSYAELQKGESAYALDHIAHGVPDLRMGALPAGYERLLAGELPLAINDVNRLRDYAARFTELCAVLAELDIQESVQHDDLHLANLYANDGRFRVVDWGDSSVAHPFSPCWRRSGSSRSSTDLVPMTPGSAGCATPTSSRGGAAWKRRSSSRSVSAGLRMRSHGAGSGMHSCPRHGQISTERSGLCCEGRSHRRPNRSTHKLENAGVSRFEAVTSDGGVPPAAATLAGHHWLRART